MIYVAFLWHHHQPMYREDVKSNENKVNYALPWVRLHCTKDYYDMVAILDDYPDIKLNFNLVPCLLEQIEEYANGIAVDKELELSLKPVSELTVEDKIYILQNFFMINWNTIINKYKRYKELLLKRGKYIQFEELSRIQSYFTDQDFLDLQVWFNLGWMDPYWQRVNVFIKNLFEKGEKFTETEKIELLKIQRDICSKIISKYKEKQDNGQIEISISPYYHPILPLIYNTNIAKFATPNIVLPTSKFNHPEDVHTQIEKSIIYYEKLFGRKPKGMWPSEGSVSEDIIPIIADLGIEWIATDEQILFNTLNMYRAGDSLHHLDILYQPYKIEKSNRTLNIIFRDRVLSDSIGFVYYNWDSKIAVDDFMARIYRINDVFSKSNPGKNCFIPIILDGENCWEYYINDGWDFLTELYSRLSSDKNIKTVTIYDYLTQNKPEICLKHLWAGSWINANFGIWIGHSEDNLAWTYLNKTRNFLMDYIEKNPDTKNSENIRKAFEEIYIAEGSDWCWWYGDEHSSANDSCFDKLFRTHLMNVYKLLNSKIPEELFIPIKSKIRRKYALIPFDFVEPTIDGKITSYFEWLSAGKYEIGYDTSAMHRVDSLISCIYYGFDLENLYIRIDFKEKEINFDEIMFKIIFLQPNDKEVYFKILNEHESESGNHKIKYSYLRKHSKDMEQEEKPLTKICVNKIVELAIPFENLETKINDNIEFVVTVIKDLYKLELERWPYNETIMLKHPTKDSFAQDWTAL
jgi:alpha-amylase/alpha-mannosidase (GH57 family)